MRCVQAIGSAAVVSVGAGSLADIFEVHERGQKVCIVLSCHVDNGADPSLACSTGCHYLVRRLVRLSVVRSVMCVSAGLAGVNLPADCLVIRMEIRFVLPRCVRRSRRSHVRLLPGHLAERGMSLRRPATAVDLFRSSC